MHLKVWIRSRGLLQRDVAEILGISPSYLSEIVTRKKRPAPELAKKIENLTENQVTRIELMYPEELQGVSGDKNSAQGTPLTWEKRKELVDKYDMQEKHRAADLHSA